MKHYETYGQFIQEILDDRCNELRSRTPHVLPIQSAHIWNCELPRQKSSLFLDALDDKSVRSSNNSKICRAVFQRLTNEYSSSTIEAVTDILYSLIYDFAQTESHNFRILPPEGDVDLFRMSGAALWKNPRKAEKSWEKILYQKRKENAKQQFTSTSQIESELDFLIELKETDKSHLPEALDILEEGYLTFVKKEFLNFLREADLKIREFVNTRAN